MPPEEVLQALYAGLSSEVPTVARNASVALGALALCGPLCPAPAEDVLDRLLLMLRTPTIAAAAAGGAAVGAAAAVDALEGLDAARVSEVASGLFTLAARGGGGEEDAAAAAAAVVALGWVAGSCLSDAAPDAQIVQDVFSLAVFTLTELVPSLEAVLQSVLALLPVGRGGEGGGHVSWAAVRTQAVDAALAAFVSLPPGDSAPIACAAITALASIVEEAKAEADAFSPLVPAVLKACSSSAASMGAGSAEYGALIGSLAALPRIVAALSAAGLIANVNFVARADMPATVLANAPDACVHAVALAAQAALLAQRSHAALHADASTGADKSAVTAAKEVESFVNRVAEEGVRSTRMPRSRYAAAAVAQAVAALLGSGPDQGGVRSACRAGPAMGLLHEPQASSAQLCKLAVTALERSCFDSAKPNRFAIWLLARCSRVRAYPDSAYLQLIQLLYECCVLHLARRKMLVCSMQFGTM